MGGRNTSRSVRVMSSGYMPPVCSKRLCRRACSVRPKRRATPGRCQTGSTATLTPETTPLSVSSTPSALRRPAARASVISGMVSVALDTAMLGWSAALAATSGKAVAARAPQGSRLTILAGSAQDGCGPMDTIGCVPARLKGRPGRRRPLATATARWMALGPEWQPMALRRCGCVSVATTGPRCAASGAPQRSGTGSADDRAGWEASLVYRGRSPASGSGPLVASSAASRARLASMASVMLSADLRFSRRPLSVDLRFSRRCPACASVSTWAVGGTRSLGRPTRSTTSMPAATMASYLVSDSDTKRSILVMPSQWSTSGESSWRRRSARPATRAASLK
mmetsp:Transcript_1966/g.6513  ORF Transcript_1966/g.6513 Transcript_1966/m.6513 type:complete len:338 (+) Transcript_1966:36-1049(+)